MSSAPVARRQLSAQIRAKRLAADMTIEQVADELEWSSTKISNIETGRSKRPAVSDIRLLLDVYKVGDTRERETILELTRQSRKRGWWSQYDDVLTSDYTSLEAGVVGLRVFELQYVPGLLQTPEYAAAITHATLIREPAEVERVVEARMRRQQVLFDRPTPVDMWAIIDQHALDLLKASDPELCRAQLEHLADLAEAPNSITIQVLGRSGLHPGMGGPFTILKYENPEQDAVFLEADEDGLYLDKRPQVDRYRRIFDLLVSKSMDPDGVAAHLRSLIS
ncbi:helix-turn-helix domain-containing protein [Nocardiopsis lambiniae]|uniref:Helix-turn-helix transcriptional regulator n=1 Tax=Nocardiopsis lambiniae TaxID=3075539 RepID=A0ABU2M5D2_9ACTN|nr:helix-turn-helix transcriptional regulator [Nocardiopsis sp. DSM 44743]MDT0327380.1 helix-turn-helix transcriptional regulator [Nocardiopsis sp. DSM 44743]